MATPNISIKLMIDTEANKVLFAEAAKDFVDLLFFLLALPIGTVTRLLTSESMVGSVGNLFTSFASLNEMYLEPSVHKNDLLDGASCTGCGKQTTETNHFLKFVAGSDEKGTNLTTPPNHSMVLQGYVKELVPYLVSDELSVTPMSTMSIISMMKACNASKLEERRVNIGTKEAMGLLKTSLQSGTVLSDVFLGRKQDKESDPTSGVELTHSRAPSSGVDITPKDQTSKKRTRSPSPPRTCSQAIPCKDGGNQAPYLSRERTQNHAASQPCHSVVSVPFTAHATPAQVKYYYSLRENSLSVERGIDFLAVDPSIRTEAARRNWLTLATHPSKEINVTVVHEFLALIHGLTPQPTSVTVRGVTVDFSSSAIMAHFKIPDFPIIEHFETVWKLSNPVLRDTKINKAHALLDKNDPAAKVWKEFVYFRFHSILISSTYPSITEDETLILLAILTKVPVHVGHLIRKIILKYEGSFWNIPFPNTISDLCHSAGVTRLASDRVVMVDSNIIRA